MARKVKKTSGDDKQIVKLVAKRISDLPKEKWNELPKEERKQYVLMAHRALSGMRVAEKRKQGKADRAAARTESSEA